MLLLARRPSIVLGVGRRDPASGSAPAEISPPGAGTSTCRTVRRRRSDVPRWAGALPSFSLGRQDHAAASAPAEPTPRCRDFRVPCRAQAPYGGAGPASSRPCSPRRPEVIRRAPAMIAKFGSAPGPRKCLAAPKLAARLPPLPFCDLPCWVSLEVFLSSTFCFVFFRLVSSPSLPLPFHLLRFFLAVFLL